MRRCRNCKQYLIVKDAPASQWWCSEICKIGYLQWKDDKKRKPKKKPKPKRKKLKSIARLVDEAAVLLQKLVRLKAADANGFVKSFTSNTVLPWQEMQGSHFIQRNRTATKLLEKNVHPQTSAENCYEMKTAHGVLKYRRAMVAMYGEELVREIEDMADSPKKYNREEVAELTAEFKRQIKEHEVRLGIS